MHDKSPEFLQERQRIGLSTAKEGSFPRLGATRCNTSEGRDPRNYHPWDVDLWR